MRRSLTLCAAVGLAASSLAIPTASATTTAPAQPSAPSQTTTPYAASGSGDLLYVDADLPVLGLDVTQIALSPVSTDVDTAGDPRSQADAANLDASLLGEIDLSEILVDVSQSAPPDNAGPVEETLIPLDLAPLLDLGVSTARAGARWPGDGVCLDSGASIAEGYNETAGLDVLDAGTGPVVSVNSAGGVSFTRSRIYTEDVAGQTGRALVSQSTSQIDEITLFEGIDGLETTVSVQGPSTLTVSSNGTTGGSTVTTDFGNVNLSGGLAGGGVIDLADIANDTGLPLGDILGQLGDLVNGLLADAGLVQLDIRTGDETLAQTINPDGTGASAEAAVAEIEITLLAALGDPLGSVVVNVGELAAATAVAPGGVVCPPEDNPLRDLHKDASQGDVAPGATFDYTLTVPNRGACTLTDVVVTDKITAPEGTTFTSDPAATSSDNNTLVFNVGELAPNETKTITISVTVPDNAPDGFVFKDELSASATCDGTPVDKNVVLDLPVVSTDFTGPCDLVLSNKAASHLEVTPGQTFNYFVHVFNRGTEPCTGTVVTDTLDDRVSFVSCTDGCTNDGQKVTFPAQTVTGGGGTTLTVTVKVADDATGTLANTAIIDSPDDEGDPVTVTVDGPVVTDRSVPAPPNPPRLTPAVTPLPRTGGDAPMVLLFGLGLAGLAALGAKRRMLFS